MLTEVEENCGVCVHVNKRNKKENGLASEEQIF